MRRQIFYSNTYEVAPGQCLPFTLAFLQAGIVRHLHFDGIRRFRIHEVSKDGLSCLRRCAMGGSSGDAEAGIGPRMLARIDFEIRLHVNEPILVTLESKSKAMAFVRLVAEVETTTNADEFFRIRDEKIEAGFAPPPIHRQRPRRAESPPRLRNGDARRHFARSLERLR